MNVVLTLIGLPQVNHDGRFKARLVADGHLTKEPVESIYSGVVSLRSLRMVVFLSQLNDLKIWGADVGIAYLEVYTDEKLCTIAGPEFKELQGHLLIMIKALHGTHSGAVGGILQPQTGPLSGPPESYLSRLLAHKFKPNKITISVIPTYLTC